MSCGEKDQMPKPKGYFRINLPKKDYQRYDSTCPFSFDFSIYAEVLADTGHASEPCWMDISYPQFRGKIHLSYKKVDNDLSQYIEDAYALKVRHIAKATLFKDQLVNIKEKNIYGLIYNIEGNNAASPIQFFVTDSSSHFLRGALYFRTVPNNDSLAPVIDFIRKDIDRVINSLEWKYVDDSSSWPDKGGI